VGIVARQYAGTPPCGLSPTIGQPLGRGRLGRVAVTFFDFFAFPTLANPEVSPDRARAIAREIYGREGAVTMLGSQQDCNARVEVAGTSERSVLKIANPVFAVAELKAQNEAMAWVATQVDGVAVPVVLPGLDGRALSAIEVGGERCIVRLVTYVEGEPLADAAYLSPWTLNRLGNVAASMSAALAEFDHEGLDRILQWDLRQAGRVVDLLVAHVGDPARATALVAAMASSRAALADIGELPVQPIHGDLTEDNVVGRRDAADRLRPCGVIDFGDLTRGWRVADLAVACASVLHRAPSDPMAVVPLVAGFDARLRLTDAEIDALWPLVVERAAVLVVSGAQQVSISPDNDYAGNAQDKDWSGFGCATSVPPSVMTASLRHVLGRPTAGRTTADVSSYGRLLPALDPADLVVLDLSTTSESLDAGRWLDQAAEADLARSVAATGHTAVTRYAECRLTRSRPDQAEAPANCALHVEIHLTSGHQLAAPFRGVLRAGDDALTISGDAVTLRVAGAVTGSDGEVTAGDVVGTAGPGLVRLQLSTLDGVLPALFVLPAAAPGWLAGCPDPSPLLGLDVESARAPASLPLSQRHAFASVQEHYYDAPPQIERGWRHHLVDVSGRIYLDMINNVTVVGHGHPRLASAALRQWSLLNTNSRFHYGVLGEFADRLASLAPDGLDAVFLVNSGTEANDLALRLARIHTGTPDVVCIREAYHGWSVATDAVSTSEADNPNAVATRPEWVHTVRAPNSYSGDFQGDDADARYVADAVATIEALVASGARIGSFIAEPFYGNAGGVPLPDGYLGAVYAEVRRTGGICIADEVQVGYGRLGEFFWGFEQQGAVPDIITIAKGMGNGQPLGAVICRGAIAESFAKEGYFFSSAGASPVSCRIGMTVLDIMRDEGLQQNALVVGQSLRTGLEALQSKHPMIGAVHGMGLYMGVELVTDPATRVPATTATAAICERMLTLGVVVQPTGDRMNVLKIKPPMCLTEASAGFFVATLDRVLTEGW
jgi:4-aminobutyrate aminotransferase-like enzyme/Ser/Thr protein kinase RdoA (MazF antagonist)